MVEISFKGEANQALAEMFDCDALTVERGATHLRLTTTDPAVLYGIIHQIDALGLELLGVRELDDRQVPIKCPTKPTKGNSE